MRARLWTVCRALALVFVVSSGALSVIVVAPGAIGAEASYVVLSDSMSPHIEAGDLIVVRAVDPADIEEGDVITFESETGAEVGLITHRIVAIERTENGRRFVTKGDANEARDRSRVAPDDIVGRVWFHLPVVGRLVLFAGTEAGIVSLVVVPSLALIGSELYALYRDIEIEQPSQDRDDPE